jgi:hypothetical protein
MSTIEELRRTDHATPLYPQKLAIEELLGRKSCGSGLKIQEYGRKDPSRCPHGTHPQKLALISPTSGGRSVDIFRSRTQATEFVFVCYLVSR